MHDVQCRRPMQLNAQLRTALLAAGCWLLAAWLRAIPIHNAARSSTGLCRRECGAAFGIRSAGAQKPEGRPMALAPYLVSFDNKLKSTARALHTQ
jgi:hypothetical protein